MEFIIGFILLVCFVGIANFFSETYKSIREKEQHEFELKKKADQQALDAQRNKDQLDLELRKKVGEDLLYKQQTEQLHKMKRNNSILKATLIGGSLLAIISILVAYSKNKPDSSTHNKNSEEAPLLQQNELKTEQPAQTENLPQHYSVSNEKHSTNLSAEMASTTSEEQLLTTLPQEEQAKQNQLSQIVSVDQVHNFIGEKIEFCGEVSQVSTTSKATYINFGGHYPKHQFSIVTWSNQLPNINENMQLCVSGVVESYKGIPQIVLQSQDQILSTS